ncbi:MAG: hypothetical protein KIT84_14045 [Labilithrix sp.]|nr:hypothetical protein [Labilithrix sp.]MCW5812142.1 hypothetical protein [Labilithrix sp.]
MKKLAVLALFLLLLTCCSDSSSAPAGDGAADRIDFELGPRTKMLDAAALAALAPGADASQTLTFDEGFGTTLARGDVLLAGVSEKTPKGLLRLVRGTTTEGGKTRVDTVMVPLQLAFKRLDVHLERRLDTSGTAPAPPPRTRPLAKIFEVGGTKQIDELVFDGDNDPGTLENQLRLQNLYEGGVELSFDLRFDWGFVDLIIDGLDKLLKCTVTFGLAPGCPDLKVPELSVSMEFKAGVATTFDQSGAASIPYKTAKFQIGEGKTFDPIPIGPLVFLPELTFEGHSEGKAGSFSRIAGHSEVGFAVGGTLSTSSGLHLSAEPKQVFEVSKVEAFLDARTSTSIGPKLKMLAYGAIGPTFGVEFVSELDVDRTRDADCYRASVGIDGTAGFEVRFPWAAIGQKITGSPEIGADVAKVAAIFGLDGTIFSKSKTFEVFPLQQVAAGPCTAPPPGTLPPGIPADDTLANPPFVPWAQRWDEPGHHYKFSAYPHNARARLALAADGNLWAVASPSTVARRFTIDGAQLTAHRFLAREDDKDVPRALSDVLVRHDLGTWLLFESGDVARLAPNRTLSGAYRYTVPVNGEEVATLRMGVTGPDDRSALVFGIREYGNNFDNAIVIAELAPNGAVERAQRFGYATSSGVQAEFLRAVRAIYNQAGDLVVAGEDEPGAAQLDTRCVVFSLKPDGAIGFATKLASTSDNGTCQVGALAEAANGDLLVPASDGHTFANAALTIVLDRAGALRHAASFRLGGESFITPTAILPLPSSGYVVVGSDMRSAGVPGTFLLRLDALGRALDGKVYRAKTEGISLGFVDAFLAKDAGVVFGGLADWGDLAASTDTTRFFAGKAFAKDGALPFNAAADATMTDLGPSAPTITATAAAFAPAAAPVTVTVAPVTLRMEELPVTATTFAP